MSDSCTLDDILAVLNPGEQITYADMIERVKQAGRPTRGIGVVLAPFSTRKRHSEEIATWREPYFDDEVEGAWTDGTLYVARKPPRDGESP